jgi:predicted DNA repair protein MutK
VMSVVGTAALLLVSGGIFHHHVPGLHHVLPPWPEWIFDALLGVVFGLGVWVLVRLCQAVWSKP